MDSTKRASVPQAAVVSRAGEPVLVPFKLQRFVSGLGLVCSLTMKMLH